MRDELNNGAADTGGWLLTLPCLRAEAEAADTDSDPVLLALSPPPVLSFTEEDENSGRWQVHAYFAKRPTRRLISALAAHFPSAREGDATISKLEATDWVSLSQEGLAAVTAGRFHVRHHADEPTSADHINLLMPASRAFGTGNHETTHGCLERLDMLRRQGHRFGNIADIGTGTGILAFAAAHLWPRAHVMASDIDPEAIAVVREILAPNAMTEGTGPGQVTLVAAAGADHPAIAGRAPYDLMIANILAGPLIALAPSLAALIADGGSLLLAGLLDDQADAVMAAYRREGLRLAARADQGRWPVLHLRKRRRCGWRRPPPRGVVSGETPGYGSW